MNWELKKQRMSSDSAIFAARPRFRWGWITVVILTLGLTLSMVAFFATRAREYVKDAIELERDTRRLALHVAGEFVLPIESLRATSAYFASSEYVTRTEFRAFTRTVLEALPQIYCFEWMPLVEDAARDSFELAVRAEGFPEFQITDKGGPTGRDVLSAPERERYLPILYMEPLDPSILGLDTGAVESTRSSTGRRAWAEERITASRPYQLLEDPEGVYSLTCYAPVFNLAGVPYDRVDTTAGEFIGLVAVIMRIQETVQRAQTNSQTENLELAIIDSTDPNNPAVVFTSNDEMQEAALTHHDRIDQPVGRPRRNAVLWSPPFPFADREWYVATRPVPGTALATSGLTPLYAMLIGLVLAGALTWGAGSLRAAAHLRRQVDAALELGQYRLGRKLGEGGMGMVFEAEHRMLARRAAIKLIRPERLGAGSTSGGDHILERFENEAKATAQLSSPHTISIFDFGRTDRGDFYYVMEFLDGFDFESLVQKHGPVDPGRVVHFLRQACHSPGRGSRRRADPPGHQTRQPLCLPIGPRHRYGQSARFRFGQASQVGGQRLRRGHGSHARECGRRHSCLPLAGSCAGQRGTRWAQ